MKRLSLLLALAPLLALGAEPAPKPVDTLDELRPLAEKATVASIDFVLPAGKGRATEKALWDRFANKPEETQFAIVTARDWKTKWKLLVEVLVTKAEQQKLGGAELQACIATLNMGLTADTAPQTIPASIGQISAKDQTGPKPPEPVESATTSEEVCYGEPSENGSEATIPVGAYLAHTTSGTCWIIVCKWEDAAPELTLGHIRIWAVDCATHKIIGFVGCD